MPKGKRNPEEMEKFMIDSYAKDLVPIKKGKEKFLRGEYEFWKGLAKSHNINLNSKTQVLMCDYDIREVKGKEEGYSYEIYRNRLVLVLKDKEPFKLFHDQRIHFNKRDVMFEGTYEECINALIWGCNFHYPPYLDDHLMDIFEFYYYGQMANPDYFKAKPFND